MSAVEIPVRTPAGIARDAMRKMAERRMSPTPENYAAVYAELSGNPAGDSPAVMSWLRQLAGELARAGAPSGAQSPIAALDKALVARDGGQAMAALVSMASAQESRQKAQWAALLRDLLRLWDARNPEWTQARKRESVDRVLTSFGADSDKLATRLGSLLKAWSERTGTVAALPALVDPQGGAPGAELSGKTAMPLAAGTLPGKPGTVGARSDPPAAHGVTPVSDSAEAFEPLRELTVDLVRLAIGDDATADERLATRGKSVIGALRQARGAADFLKLAPAIRELQRQVMRAQGRRRETSQGLLTLLHLIVSNIEALVPDERWVHGQIEKLRAIIAEPLDGTTLSDAEQAFRDIVVRQGSLRRSIEDAKAALRNMLASFVERLGTVTDATGDYQGKVQAYAARIEKVDDLSQLPIIIKGLLEDTRSMQADMMRAREELVSARTRAAQYEAQIAELERELTDVSALLKSDPLTGVLNRRGMNESFVVESARCDREGKPLCVALLDVDNFKSLNDTHGHGVGDQALQHLANVVRSTVRPTDVVARYGGEEFVVLLPNTAADEAVEIMTRVQRQLTRAFFLQNNERLLITFSAGVALRRSQEPQGEALTRADEGLYRAKRTGKNKVVFMAESDS